jgi:hypothetical protein
VFADAVHFLDLARVQLLAVEAEEIALPVSP